MSMGGEEVKFSVQSADIRSMKKSALVIMCIVGMALSAEEYTIQTISALKESSITPAFEQKVQKTALPSDRKKEGACNIVTVGHFADRKGASRELKKAKTVAKDAFVRTVARSVPKVCEAPLSSAEKKAPSDLNATVAASGAAQGEAKAQAVEKPVQGGAEGAAAPATAAATEPKTAAAAECPPLGAEKEAASSAQTVHTSVIIYDRNLARKSDIHEAIEYYKHSPYHSFRPVALQGSPQKGW